MTGVEVGHGFLNLTADVFKVTEGKGTIIDSGTTLAYLPEVIYEPMVKKVLPYGIVLFNTYFLDYMYVSYTYVYMLSIIFHFSDIFLST